MEGTDSLNNLEQTGQIEPEAAISQALPDSPSINYTDQQDDSSQNLSPIDPAGFYPTVSSDMGDNSTIGQPQINDNSGVIIENQLEKPNNKLKILKFLGVFLFIAILGVGAFFCYKLVIFPKGSHVLVVKTIQGEEKGKDYASFSLQNGWISKPGEPSNSGYPIELFPSNAEYKKGINDVEHGIMEGIYWKFRTIGGQKGDQKSVSGLLDNPQKLEKFKTGMSKISDFDKFIEKGTNNVKNLFCWQNHKNSLYYISCMFETNTNGYYQLNLSTNVKYYDQDYQTFFKIINTIKP